MGDLSSKKSMTAQNSAVHEPDCEPDRQPDDELVCEADATLDVRGLVCPMPVLKARKALKGLSSGATLKVLATDRAAIRDMPEFCKVSGHVLVSTTQAEGEIVFLIQHA